MLTPTQNYVFIKLHDIATDSGIHLPEGTRRKPYGEIISVGPDSRLTPGTFVHFMPSALIGYDEAEATCFIAEPSILAVYHERP